MEGSYNKVSEHCYYSVNSIHPFFEDWIIVHSSNNVKVIFRKGNAPEKSLLCPTFPLTHIHSNKKSCIKTSLLHHPPGTHIVYLNTEPWVNPFPTPSHKTQNLE